MFSINKSLENKYHNNINKIRMENLFIIISLTNVTKTINKNKMMSRKIFSISVYITHYKEKTDNLPSCVKRNQTIVFG